MVLRPLPTPFRIGTDICFIPRIRKLLSAGTRHHRHVNDTDNKNSLLESSGMNGNSKQDLVMMSEHLNPRFLARLFRPREIALLARFYESVASTMAHGRLYEHVAGRWAAKEAIIKAASQSYPNSDGSFRKPTFHDIEIWTSNKRLEAAILLKRTRDAHAQVEPTSGMTAEVERPTRDVQPNRGQENIDNHDATPELDGDMVEISISHDKDYAIATALFCDPS